jgi:hypothetical protein
MFNSELPVHIYADASNYTVGVVIVIMQPHPDGEKVVEYASSTLRGHQRQWTISEKESFAILFCQRSGKSISMDELMLLYLRIIVLYVVFAVLANRVTNVSAVGLWNF